MKNKDNKFIFGRGAQINTEDPFAKYNYVDDEDNHPSEPTKIKTDFQEVHPKTIVNKVNSPDIHFNFSINPYQGCEHGCVYCYARNTHPYWGYSAGIEFESKILYKQSAAILLEKKLSSRNWKAQEIMLSGNTDCYQPIEKKLGITRALLELFWKYRHPVGIITKNSLILRDKDLLEKLANENLVKVNISITTEDESLRAMMEPRTSTTTNRIRVIEELSAKGVPVGLMMAPIIPGLTDSEILPIAKKAAEAGAVGMNYTMIRLIKDVIPIFEDWLEKTMPDRKDKILNQIKDSHKGQLGSSEWKERMKGSGNIAQIIRDQILLARKIYFKDRIVPDYNYDLHEQFKYGQMKLF